MVSRKTIVLIGGNPDTFILLERELCASYSVVFFKGIQQALDFLYTNVPDLVLIEWQENDEATADVLRTFKAEPLFRQLPFLAILGEPNSVLNWDILPVEDYLRRKDLEAEVLNRVELCILRSERLLEINPSPGCREISPSTVKSSRAWTGVRSLTWPMPIWITSSPSTTSTVSAGATRSSASWGVSS
jgi:CheY-like chemotaxis protein